MKATLFLVLFSLSLVLAQPGGAPLVSWAGSLTGVNTTWNATVSVMGPSCSNTTASTGVSYVSLNYTFNTTGVRQILALGSGINVVVFNGSVNIQNPCLNAVAVLTQENEALTSGEPTVEDYFNFQANQTYVFIVSSSSGSAGDFALGIFSPVATGNLAGANTWNPISQSSSSPYTCATTSNPGTPYATFSWLQSTTGLYDVTAGFAQYLNSSYDYWGSYSYISVFRGNVTTAVLTGANVCTATASSLVVAFGEVSRAAHQYGLQLSAGQWYTVVASGSETDNYGNYGFFVAPSRVSPAVVLPTGFDQPNYGEPDCETWTAYTNQSYAASSFVAGPNTFTVLLQVAYGYSSYLGYTNWTLSSSNNVFVYNGNNTGSSTAAPQTCPQASSSYLYSTSSALSTITTVPNQVYSVVVSTTASDNSEYNGYLVYTLTGTPVGNVNTSTGTTSTTGTGSATGGATNGGIANGGHSSTTNFTASTTNAGSAVVSSIVFVVLAILALLF